MGHYDTRPGGVGGSNRLGPTASGGSGASRDDRRLLLARLAQRSRHLRRDPTWPGSRQGRGSIRRTTRRGRRGQGHPPARRTACRTVPAGARARHARHPTGAAASGGCADRVRRRHQPGHRRHRRELAANEQTALRRQQLDRPGKRVGGVPAGRAEAAQARHAAFEAKWRRQCRRTRRHAPTPGAAPRAQT